MTATTYREWLDGRPPEEANLREYLRTIAPEYWNSEFKAAEIETNFGVRKAVAALANARGGEVFLGVRDKDREPLGTEMTSDRLTQVLKQENASLGTWYVVDLNQPVESSLSVSVGSSDRVVHVLRVRRPGVPVFVRHDDGTLNLYVRRGASSELRNSFGALEWNRMITREEILRTCFLEFQTLARRIVIDFRTRSDLGLPAVSFGSALPYLVKRMEDGSLYTCLSDDDLVDLLGKSLSGGGYTFGFLGRFLALENSTRRVLERLEKQGKDPFSSWYEVVQQLTPEFGEIASNVEGFRRYLEEKGISVQGIP